MTGFLPDGVTVAQQILVLFALVRIQVGQRWFGFAHQPGSARSPTWFDILARGERVIASGVKAERPRQKADEDF